MNSTPFRLIWTASILSVCTSIVAAPTYSLSTLLSFNYANGANPTTRFVADGDGNLYGTTYRGGQHDSGTVFQLAAGTHAVTTVATFDGGNGTNPIADLITGSDGNLYGTTAYGGLHSKGTLFRFDVGTHTLTTLASFDGSNGANPFAGLLTDGWGNLYGLTAGGGPLNLGTVFRWDAGTRDLTAVVAFDGANGAGPDSNLVADTEGNLYGSTEQGGAHNLGTVFRVAAGSHALSTLATFDGSNGSYPQSILLDDGKLYGTTLFGGTNDLGTVFEMSIDSPGLSTFATFDGENGALPAAGLLLDADGNFYGTTAAGGESDLGTVFRLSSSTRSLTTLATFDGMNGSQSVASLIADADGNLYGTAQAGGEHGFGTVFRLAVIVPEPNARSVLLCGAVSISALIVGRRQEKPRVNR